VVRHLRISEVLAGIEGLALLRGMFDGTDAEAERRLDEVRAIIADEEGHFGGTITVPEHEVETGYGRWSSTYDNPGNPLIAAEQKAVWAVLDTVAPGRALDAACGTGRHSRYLVDHGHAVVGLDQTPEMLSRAREQVPEATFAEGDLLALPFENASFDLIVCALALEHVDDLGGAAREFARVLRPRGRLVVSESHPVLKALGGAPFFLDSSGAAGVVRNNRRMHSDYLDAFAAAQMTLNRCIEKRFGVEEARMQQPAASLFPEAAEAAFAGLPAVLIWDVGGRAP
jgi:ubiquinone/menaquinone biosynthesis C-methylase UbiE